MELLTSRLLSLFFTFLAFFLEGGGDTHDFFYGGVFVFDLLHFFSTPSFFSIRR